MTDKPIQSNHQYTILLDDHSDFNIYFDTITVISYIMGKMIEIQIKMKNSFLTKIERDELYFEVLRLKF
jgi:hypothetical protein